jgi:hypothetical protein
MDHKAGNQGNAMSETSPAIAFRLIHTIGMDRLIFNVVAFSFCEAARHDSAWSKQPTIA